MWLRQLSLLGLLLLGGARLTRAQCGPDGARPYPPGTTTCPAGPGEDGPPQGGPGGGGPGGGAGDSECPESGVGYTGSAAYLGAGAKAAPLRGAVGCVDASSIGAPLTVQAAGQQQIASVIFGPMEAGFNDGVPGMSCLGPTNVVPGGIDTLMAENMAAVYCGVEPSAMSVLDECGGHALPYHYHERMSCLYTSDPATGHSTRIGTMADGNGLYGMYLDADNTLPTDLDACGGRTGVTPDSNGQEVYYYMVQERAPFTVGCFGPATLDECRALYSTCGDGDVITITTVDYGELEYDPDCPCYDPHTHSNVPSGGAAGEESSETPTAVRASESPDTTESPETTDTPATPEPAPSSDSGAGSFNVLLPMTIAGLLGFVACA